MSVSRLKAFREGLQSVAGGARNERPFMCDGDPYGCKAFLVGFNPASDIPFWDSWSDEYGCDKVGWFEAYKAQRMARPLKPERKRQYPVSSTRRRIDWIVQAVLPVKVLETNLYGTPTSVARELADVDRRTEAFAFLLAEIKPAAMIVHGGETKRAFEQRFGCQLASELSRVCADGLNVEIMSVRHLSRGVSQAQAEAWGRLIGSLVM